MPPHEKLLASAPSAPLTTDALDTRVRRLEQILATCRRDDDSASGQDESAAAAALKQFPAVLQTVRQFTEEVRSRIGAGDWDAADVLAARLLLDSVTSALRTCRVVSRQAASRLADVERTVNAGHKFHHREAARRKP